MSHTCYYFASLRDLTNRVTASAVDSLPLAPFVGNLCMRRTYYYFASLCDLTNRVTASAVDSLPLAPFVGNLCMRRTYYYFASLCDLANRVTASAVRCFQSHRHFVPYSWTAVAWAVPSFGLRPLGLNQKDYSLNSQAPASNQTSFYSFSWACFV